MADVETLARQRAWNLFFFTTTYAIWYGAYILNGSGWFGPHARSVLEVVFAAFLFLWILASLSLALWARRARTNPKALAALNDEMTVRNRWRAQRASAFTLLICLMIGVVIASYTDVSGRLAMEVLIWILVVSQIGFYLWYDRSE